MAEREGFEPSVPILVGTHDFQSCPFGQLGHLSILSAMRIASLVKHLNLILWRRGWDSNPRLLLGEPLFESGALNQLGNLSPMIFFLRVFSPHLLWHIKFMPESGMCSLASLTPPSSLLARAPNPRLLLGEPLFENGALNQLGNLSPMLSSSSLKKRSQYLSTFLLKNSSFNLENMIKMSFIKQSNS